MPDLSGMGDLVLTVGGDISPLESALNEVPAVAQQAASQIQAAFDAIPSATDDVAAGLAAIGDAATQAGAEASTAGEQLAGMTEGVAEGASQAAGSIEQMPPALHDTAEAAMESESALKEFIITSLELAGVVLSLEALKEAIIGSLEAFGELQRAGVALTAITGDAEAAKSALEGIPALADQIGASIGSLEQASVKFARFGVDLEQLPGLFSSIADAALASGQSFDTVASAWERIDMTGKVMARSLMAAGVSVQDLSKALGLDATASIKDVSAAMSELGSGAERAAVLMAAVPDSVKGLASSADTVTKSFQQMENAVTLAKEHIGQALADLSQSGGMTVLKDIIKGIETVIVTFIGYLGQAIDIIRGFGKMAVDEFQAVGQAFSDIVGGKGMSQAIADLKAGDDKAAADFHNMAAQMQLDWTKNGNIIDDIWTDTTTKVAASTAKIPKAMQAAAADVIAEGLHTQQALVLGEEGLTNSWSDLSKEFDAVTKQMNLDIDLMNTGTPRTAANMAALQGMVNTLASMQVQLRDQGLLNSIQGMAAGLALTSANAKEGDATIKIFFGDLASGSKSSVEPLTASATAAKGVAAAVVDATKNWEPYITGAKGAAAQLVALETGMRQFGLTSQQAFAAQLAAAQQLLSAMQQQNQPLMQQLALQDKILQLQLQHSVAVGASGTATLALTEKLQGVRLQEELIYDRTTALSSLYSSMLKDFSEAWGHLGNAIGDAMVSGQNFGQVLTNVFDDLKKKIAELVTNYLLGMLKDSLLQNTNLMQDFNKVFNSIFASGGSLSTGLQSTSQAFSSNSQIMVSSFGQATDAVKNGASQMSSSMAQTASSVSQSAATMLSGLTLIATAIGAIAGIFSAIELAHTNTLLARIEESTRRMDIATEQQGDSVLATLHAIRDKAIIATDFLWNFLAVAMQQVMLKMDAELSLLSQISQGIWTGGGGGSAAGQASALGTTLQPTVAIPQAAQMLEQASQAVSDAGNSLTDAAAAQSTAADQSLQASIQQAQLTTAATQATTYAAENMTTAAQAMTTAGQDLSYSGLKAATVVNDLTATVIPDAVNYIGQGMTAVAGATAMVSTFLAAHGGPALTYTPGGTNTFSPFVMPALSLPAPGPSGGNTAGLAPGVFTPFYQPTVGGTGPAPVTLQVQGSQFVQMLFDEFVRNMQSQGIRLTRG